MKGFTFFDLTKKVLAEKKKALTAREIWEIAKTKGYDRDIGNEGKTPWLTIGALIYVSIRYSKDTPFRMEDGSPRRFKLRTSP